MPGEVPMRALIIAITLALAITGATYVRRGPCPLRAAITAISGSRDRQLPGKQRIRARRAA